MKICTKCLQEKPLSEYSQSSVWGRLESHCKECIRKQVREYRLTHPPVKAEPGIRKIPKRRPVIL